MFLQILTVGLLLNLGVAFRDAQGLQYDIKKDDGSTKAGDACRGGWFGDNHAGTCKGTKKYKCYREDDTSKHADKGVPGICLVAYKYECDQAVDLDESSGGCRGKTVCRKFKYAKSTVAGEYIEIKSLCVHPENKDDNKLIFHGAGAFLFKVTALSGPNAAVNSQGLVTSQSKLDGPTVPGKACRGGTWFDRNSGTCKGTKMYKCYQKNDKSKHAGHGNPGICLIARKYQCEQETPGDESSGGCRGGTVCRKFRYTRQMMMGTQYEEIDSYCVEPENKDDINLSWNTDVMPYNVVVALTGPDKRV